MLKKLKNHLQECPRGLFVLFYTEAQELFGRFGITALLVLYLTKTLHISDAKAFTIYSAFLALNYITPILGGFISDRYLGFTKSVMVGGITMSIGDALMIIPRPELVYLGLAIVAIGSGFFTPTLAAMVGRLYPKNSNGRDTGFTVYYIGKNIGALLAPFFCGFIGQYFGFNYAFILSTLGMISGVVVFGIGKKHLKENTQEIKRSVKHRVTTNGLIYLLMLLLIPVALLTLQLNIDGFLLIGAVIAVAFIIGKVAVKLDKEHRRNILFIMIMLLFVMIFYACLGQGGTTLNLFIDRIVNRNLFGFTIPTPVLYTLDPLFMIALGPFLALFFVRLAKKNFKISEVSKFAYALFILALGFLVFVVASSRAVGHGHVSMFYVVLAYLLFPIAELCIMPIGLSLVTRYAPRNLEAMMVGVFMLASAVASYLTGVISKVGQVNFNFTTSVGFSHAAKVYMHLFAETAIALMCCGILIFILKPLLKKLLTPAKEETVTPASTAMEL